MKNLLITSGTTGTDLSTLARGAWAIVTAAGVVQSEVPATGMYKYVVGLGGGKNIEGLWLNADNKVSTKQTYAEGAKKSVTIASIAFDPTVTTDAEIHIQTQPKSAFSGLDYQEFVAVVPVISTTQETKDIEAALIVKLTQLVKDINKYFGKNVITPIAEGGSAPTTLVGLALTAVDTDFNFYITFGGNATGKTTESNTLTFGTQAEVIKLEKEMAIATFGYNPNFEAGDHVYGNVLLAGEFGASGYDIYVISSVAPATDQMPLHPDGAKVEQWIAVPKGNDTFKA